MISKVGEGDCDNKEVSDGAKSRESDGEGSYSKVGNSESSIPAIVMTTIIISACYNPSMYNIKSIDD